VQGTALFTHLTCDHAQRSTFWAGDARLPFLEYRHQVQADPPKTRTSSAQPIPRARETAARRASGHQPIVLAAADSTIKAS
jgi:hypothetical protein